MWVVTKIRPLFFYTPYIQTQGTTHMVVGDKEKRENDNTRQNTKHKRKQESKLRTGGYGESRVTTDMCDSHGFPHTEEPSARTSRKFKST